MEPSQRAEFDAALASYGASVWGDCPSFRSFSQFATACSLGDAGGGGGDGDGAGSPEDPSQDDGVGVVDYDGNGPDPSETVVSRVRRVSRAVEEEACGALGPQCSWAPAAGACVTNSLAMVRTAFGAAANSSAAVAAGRCVAARTQEVCAAAGSNVTVDAAVVQALAAGRTTLEDGTEIFAAEPVRNASPAAVLADVRNGAAAATSRAGRPAAILLAAAALLLVVLMA